MSEHSYTIGESAVRVIDTFDTLCIEANSHEALKAVLHELEINCPLMPDATKISLTEETTPRLSDLPYKNTNAIHDVLCQLAQQLPSQEQLTTWVNRVSRDPGSTPELAPA